MKHKPINCFLEIASNLFFHKQGMVQLTFRSPVELLGDAGDAGDASPKRSLPVFLPSTSIGLFVVRFHSLCSYALFLPSLSSPFNKKEKNRP